MSGLSGYFWYSSQQKEAVSKMLSYNRHTNYCRVGSKVLEYTEMTSSPVNTSKWNDIVFLGKGVYVEHYLHRTPKHTREGTIHAKV